MLTIDNINVKDWYSIILNGQKSEQNNGIYIINYVNNKTI